MSVSEELAKGELVKYLATSGKSLSPNQKKFSDSLSVLAEPASYFENYQQYHNRPFEIAGFTPRGTSLNSRVYVRDSVFQPKLTFGNLQNLTDETWTTPEEVYLHELGHAIGNKSKKNNFNELYVNRENRPESEALSFVNELDHPLGNYRLQAYGELPFGSLSPEDRRKIYRHIEPFDNLSSYQGQYVV